MSAFVNDSVRVWVRASPVARSATTVLDEMIGTNIYVKAGNTHTHTQREIQRERKRVREKF